MKVTIKYMLYFVTAVIHACVDPISFETDSVDGELVFYGNFSQLNQNHIFNISLTSELGKSVTPISGAVIEIMDAQGKCADYQEVETGKYQLAADKMQGVPGRSYYIEITLNNGKSYFSEPQVMPQPIEVEDIYFNIESRQILSSSDVLVDKTFIDVFIDTPLQNSSGGFSPLRWTVEEVYSFVDRACGPFDIAGTCYFIDPPDESEVLIFKDEGGAQNNLNGFRVRSRQLVPFDEFTGRHYFNVRQYTVSEEEFDYWNKIKQVSSQSGNLFDVQPAKVPGNIHEKDNEQALVLGYFGVNGQNVVRIFTTPNEIRPLPVFTCMDESFFVDHLPECCACEAKEGNQIERPAYWDEG